VNAFSVRACRAGDGAPGSRHAAVADPGATRLITPVPVGGMLPTMRDSTLKGLHTMPYLAACVPFFSPTPCTVFCTTVKRLFNDQPEWLPLSELLALTA